ncbi:hypothetical protein WFJ45_23385, partial [Salmonella enterica subsp. enterica serovar Minnesota]|uniref:hypothetical protein n=1 Tax=Salmonella enterica TaxID=28901 RepID=UPI003D2D2462
PIYADVIAWERQAGARLPQDRAFERAFRLADTHQHLGQLQQASEQAFEALWRQLGLSVDWSMTYATISRAAQRVRSEEHTSELQS